VNETCSCNFITQAEAKVTGCVIESGDPKNVMKNKCFYVFSFNTYEQNVYIKEFRFFQFKFNPFNNLTHLKKVLLSENNIIQMTTIPLYALGKSLANVTHYSLKHLHRN
jgi:hypothetical protein